MGKNKLATLKCIKFLVAISMGFTCFNSMGLVSLDVFASSGKDRNVITRLTDGEQTLSPLNQTETPVTPEPTEVPATPEPTIAPATPEPTVAPVTPEPTIAPVTPEPTINPTLEPTQDPAIDSALNEMKTPEPSPSTEPIENPSEAVLYSVLTTNNITVPVSIIDENGLAIENAPTTINAGEINANLPSVAGYQFTNATVNDIGVVGTGEYEGNLYYSTDGISTIQLESKVVVLHYTKEITDYTIDYLFNASQGTVTGETSVVIGGSIGFTVTPMDGYSIAKVTTNNNDLSATSEGNYEYTPNENTTIKVEFEKSEYAISYYAQGNRVDAIKTGPTIVKKGDTLTFIIEFSGSVGWFNDSCLLKNLTINGQVLNIPSKNDAEQPFTDAEINGMKVSMAYSYNNKTTLTFTITNISENLDIGYNIVDTGGVDDAVITINELQGVTLYHYTGNAKQPGASLEVVRSGEVIKKNGGVDAFFVAPKPGYSSSITGANDSKNISITGQNGYNGSDAAKGYNALYEFGYSSSRGQPKNRKISLYAAPIQYSVSYKDGENTVNDQGRFTIESGKNSVVMPNSTNIKEGFTFAGYEIGGKVYNVGETFTINVNTVGYANENNEFAFTAVWNKNTTPDKEENRTAYSINFYFQDSEDSTQYILDKNKTIHTYGDLGAIVFHIAKAIDGYVPNVEKNRAATISYLYSDNQTVLRVYYDINYVTVTFDLNGGLVNGNGDSIELSGAEGTQIDKNLIPDPVLEGYTYKWSKQISETFGKTNVSYKALWTENDEVSINYFALTGGSVSNETERVKPVTGQPIGSTAISSTGYEFVGWTLNQDGTGPYVTSEATLVPVKGTTTSMFEDGQYYAVFRVIVAVVVPPTPTPTPQPIITPIVEEEVIVQPIVNQPVVNVPQEVVTEDETPLVAPTATPVVEEIENDATPEVVTQNRWALINLIAVLATTLMAAYYVIKGKKEDDNKETSKHSLGGKVLSVIIAFGSILVFALTENLSNPMTLVDGWTLTMLLIALIQIALLVFVKKQEEKQKSFQ